MLIIGLGLPGRLVAVGRHRTQCRVGIGGRLLLDFPQVDPPVPWLCRRSMRAGTREFIAPAPLFSLKVLSDRRCVVRSATLLSTALATSPLVVGLKLLRSSPRNSGAAMRTAHRTHPPGVRALDPFGNLLSKYFRPPESPAGPSAQYISASEAFLPPTSGTSSMPSSLKNRTYLKWWGTRITP